MKSIEAKVNVNITISYLQFLMKAKPEICTETEWILARRLKVRQSRGRRPQPPGWWTCRWGWGGGSWSPKESFWSRSTWMSLTPWKPKEISHVLSKGHSQLCVCFNSWIGGLSKTNLFRRFLPASSCPRSGDPADSSRWRPRRRRPSLRPGGIRSTKPRPTKDDSGSGSGRDCPCSGRRRSATNFRRADIRWQDPQRKMSGKVFISYLIS